MKYARIFANRLDRSQLFDADQEDGAIYFVVPSDLDLSVMYWQGAALVEDELMVFYRNGGNMDAMKERQNFLDNV